MPSPRTLAIVVSAPADMRVALELARAARAGEVEVGLFFMSDAVAELPGMAAALRELAEEDCDLIACAHSAWERGLSQEDAGMLLGSQDDHAALVHRADRTVAFT
jgi:sulfur relay (sulfurtransferase) complex TusBCD TusD component (DsrE family)